MNSHRRGVASHDADAVERKKWYADLRKLGEELGKAADEKECAPLTGSSGSGSAGPAAAGPSFGGFAMALAEESAKKAAESAAAGAAAAKAAATALADEAAAAAKVTYVRARDFDASRWVVPLNSPARPVARLVCFHGIGCNHLFFKSWGPRFEESGIALSAVCLPGRLFRLHEKCKSVHEAAWAIVDALSTLAPYPCFLFGHDLGAMVAFEVTKLLDKQLHVAVAALVVSAAPSPTLVTAANADRFVTKFFCASDTDLMERVRILGAELEVFENRNRREMFKFLLPTIRSDYTLFEKYAASKGSGQISLNAAALSCRITAVGAAGDRSCDASALSAWAAETSSPRFVLHEFNSGGHSYMNLPEKEGPLLGYLVELCLGVSPAFPQEELDW